MRKITGVRLGTTVEIGDGLKTVTQRSAIHRSIITPSEHDFDRKLSSIWFGSFRRE
jgi:hypothetical protein